jgi:hypothetical protein
MQKAMLGTLPTMYGAMRMALFPPLLSGGVRLDLFSLTLRHTVHEKASLWSRMSFGLRRTL